MLHLHITTHNKSKLEGFKSLNTSTLQNGFCDKMRVKDTVCAKCYAATIEKIRPIMSSAIAKNNAILSESIIDSYDLPKIFDLYFRFNSFGELINTIHFENLLNICELNHKTTFSLWTKRIDIVQKVLKRRVKPSNLILIQSSPVINKQATLSKCFDKVFTVWNKKESANTSINCNSKCKDCLLCYTHNDVINVNEILK